MGETSGDVATAPAAPPIAKVPEPPPRVVPRELREAPKARAARGKQEAAREKGAATEARTLPSDLRVLLRPGGRIQFGVEPGRCVVWPLPRDLPPGPVLSALLAATRGSCLVGGLAGVGLPTAVASELHDELVRAGLAGDRVFPRRVTVIGRDALKWRIAEGLRARGHAPGARVPDRATRAWLATAATDAIGMVVLTGMEVPDEELLKVLRGRDIPHLPVVLRDGRGIIGPFTGSPGGPCAACAERHRLDADPGRALLAIQLRALAPAGGPEVIAATAATVVAQLPDPGRLTSAEAIVDPVGLTSAVRLLVPHPGCAVCGAGR